MDNESKEFKIILYITVSLSILSLLFMNYLLKDKQSNYSKLMNYICLAEAMYIYSEFMIIMTTTNQEFEHIVFQGLNFFLLNVYNYLNK